MFSSQARKNEPVPDGSGIGSKIVPAASLRGWLGIVAAAVLLAGCGGSGHPPTYSVSGKVVYKDQPVEGAEVIFTPVAAEPARPARGKTDAQGRFQLRTYFSPTADAAGALAGDYKVSVSKIEIDQKMIGDINFTPPKNQLPERYAAPGTSGLTATVTSRGSTPEEFKLTD